MNFKLTMAVSILMALPSVIRSPHAQHSKSHFATHAALDCL